MSCSKPQQPKFNLHRRFPLEVRLDVFGFLIHAEWTRLAGHNRKTFKVLMGNLRYLAPLPRLYSLEFVYLFLFFYYFLSIFRIIFL
jgi:hypothetical protein